MSGFMKDFALTREELDRQLGELEKTRDDFAPRRRQEDFAMCYSPAPYREPEHVSVQATCDGCGRQFVMRNVWCNHGNTVTKQYDWVAWRFRNLGYDAQIHRYCERCILREEKLHPLQDGSPRMVLGGLIGIRSFSNLYFAFRTNDTEEYHLSPLRQSECFDDHLKVAYQFLKSPKSYTELYAECDSDGYDNPESIRKCIELVLGIGTRWWDKKD